MRSQPCVQKLRVARTQVVTVTPESPGIPRAMVYGLFRALPGDRALLPPSFREITPRTLTPASGGQDHTTSPSASSALVFCAISVHRSPPHVRDDRETPLLVRRDDLLLFLIPPSRQVKFRKLMKVRPWMCGEAEYFWKEDRTTRIGLNRFRKLEF